MQPLGSHALGGHYLDDKASNRQPSEKRQSADLDEPLTPSKPVRSEPGHRRSVVHDALAPALIPDLIKIVDEYDATPVERLRQAIQRKLESPDSLAFHSLFNLWPRLEQWLHKPFDVSLKSLICMAQETGLLADCGPWSRNIGTLRAPLG